LTVSVNISESQASSCDAPSSPRSDDDASGPLGARHRPRHVGAHRWFVRLGSFATPRASPPRRSARLFVPCPTPQRLAPRRVGRTYLVRMINHTKTTLEPSTINAKGITSSERFADVSDQRYAAAIVTATKKSNAVWRRRSAAWASIALEEPSVGRESRGASGSPPTSGVAGAGAAHDLTMERRPTRTASGSRTTTERNATQVRTATTVFIGSGRIPLDRPPPENVTPTIVRRNEVPAAAKSRIAQPDLLP